MSDPKPPLVDGDPNDIDDAGDMPDVRDDPLPEETDDDA